MVAINKPTCLKPICLSRVGVFEGNLLEHLCRYSDGFKPMPRLSFIEKYGLYVPETPSVIITSKSTDGSVLPPHNSNTAFTVVSYSRVENEKIFREFSEKTGIKLPYDNKNSLYKNVLMPFLFIEIIRVGPMGMDLLSKMA